MFAHLVKLATASAVVLFIVSCSSNGQASQPHTDAKIHVDASAAAVQPSLTAKVPETAPSPGVPAPERSVAKSDVKDSLMASTLCSNVPDRIFIAFKDITSCEVLTATVKEKLSADMSAEEIEAELSQLYCMYFAPENHAFRDGMFRLPAEGNETAQAVPLPLKKGDSLSEAEPMPYMAPECSPVN